MKYKEVVKMIEDDGRYEVRQRGSHRACKDQVKVGIVTIAYHRMSDEVPRGTFYIIYKQAGIK
jgi:predicted RNA binding protein YcfA (HicA-like mRNA interferase family)